MKTFKSSDLTNNKRAEVFEEATKNGVIIEMRKTNGKVMQEFVLQVRTPLTEFTNAVTKHYEDDDTLLIKR